MSDVTREQAQEMIDEYMAAEKAALAGSSYSIGNRQLTRQNLKEIRDGLAYWRGELRRLTRGGPGKFLARG